MRSRQACQVSRPALRQIERSVNEGMAFGRNIGGENADLAVGHLAGRPGVLAPHATRRLALLEEPGLVDDQHGIVRAEMLHHILAHDVAQSIRIPPPAAQDRLLAPWSSVASRFSAHPARLAALVAQQAIQEAVRRRRNPLLTEQWPHPPLHFAQRRRP